MSALLPLPDESAASFAFRLARKERLSLQEFCQGRLGLTATQARSDLDQLLTRICSEKLAALAGIPESAVMEMKIPCAWVESTWDRQRRRHEAPIHVCPVCLAENLYGRRFWRTPFAFVCPKHGVEMVGLCPHCKSALTYFSASDSPWCAHWLENWPTCSLCVRHISRGQMAHPLLIGLTQQWSRAFEGETVRGLTAQEYLRLSAKCLFRFRRERRYRTAALRMRLVPPWAAQKAASLLLHAMLNGPLTIDVFQAAIGGKFDAASLAHDLNSIWRSDADRATWYTDQ